MPPELAQLAGLLLLLLAPEPQRGCACNLWPCWGRVCVRTAGLRGRSSCQQEGVEPMEEAAVGDLLVRLRKTLREKLKRQLRAGAAATDVACCCDAASGCLLCVSASVPVDQGVFSQRVLAPATGSEQSLSTAVTAQLMLLLLLVATLSSELSAVQDSHRLVKLLCSRSLAPCSLLPLWRQFPEWRLVSSL